ncbi:hypothetical protein [Amycolatopsis sp. NPDC051102]|uniref:hypothetical protein n=1 Tax=Amycolatopsis sp. NPDC051102 TaxID=3155163 RepID=UPI00343FAC6F
MTAFDSWWPRQHDIGFGDLAEAVLEPKPAGRWCERTVDGALLDLFAAKAAA